MTPHIEAKKEEIADVVIMPGDPLRAKMIAEEFLDDYKLVNKVRNMFGYTGYYEGRKVTVFASGMGMGSMGIYAYELFKFYDVKTIIRVGTCGSFNPDIKLRDIILSSGAFSKSYFDQLLDNRDIDFIPATSSLNERIVEVSTQEKIDLKIGKTITSDVFDLYCDSEEEFRSNFPDDNFIGVEMEAFALLYVAAKLKREAACLLTVVDSLFDKSSMSSEERERSLKDMIKLSLEAIK